MTYLLQLLRASDHWLHRKSNLLLEDDFGRFFKSVELHLILVEEGMFEYAVTLKIPTDNDRSNIENVIERLTPLIRRNRLKEIQFMDFSKSTPLVLDPTGNMSKEWDPDDPPSTVLKVAVFLSCAGDSALFEETFDWENVYTTAQIEVMGKRLRGYRKMGLSETLSLAPGLDQEWVEHTLRYQLDMHYIRYPDEPPYAAISYIEANPGDGIHVLFRAPTDRRLREWGTTGKAKQDDDQIHEIIGIRQPDFPLRVIMYNKTDLDFLQFVDDNGRLNVS